MELSWHGDPEFPIYYQWSFRTGPGGDFEDLVGQIQKAKKGVQYYVPAASAPK